MIFYPGPAENIGGDYSFAKHLALEVKVAQYPESKSLSQTGHWHDPQCYIVDHNGSVKCCFNMFNHYSYNVDPGYEFTSSDLV